MSFEQIRALEYIKDTNYGASLEDFKEDWAPIGTILWNNLIAKNLAMISNDGKVILTLQGKAFMKKKNRERT